MPREVVFGLHPVEDKAEAGNPKGLQQRDFAAVTSGVFFCILSKLCEISAKRVKLAEISSDISGVMQKDLFPAAADEKCTRKIRDGGHPPGTLNTRMLRA